jgi:hypothetical protein
MLLFIMNDDNDINLDESEDEPQVPTIVATNPGDPAGCDQFVATAHIALNGVLMDTLTGRDIDIRGIGEDPHSPAVRVGAMVRARRTARPRTAPHPAPPETCSQTGEY